MNHSIRSTSKIPDKPLPPRGIDIEIGRHNGTTVSLDAMTQNLQASKKATSGNLSQRIEELTKEHGYLRLEVRYYQQMQAAVQSFREDVTFCVDRLQNAILSFDKMHKEVEEDWYQACGERRMADAEHMEGIQRH